MRAIDKIGLGTVQFGLNYGISNAAGKTPLGEVDNIIDFSKKNGIRYIDTAAAYGNSEKVLGDCGVQGFRVITKFMPDAKGESLSIQLDRSLERLNLSSVYGYLAHRPEDLAEAPEQWEELQNLKQIGKIEKIGYSLNRPQELEQLLTKTMIPDLIQVPFNIFDKRFQHFLEELSREGCEIHTRSAFLQGLFFMPPHMLGAHFDPVKELLSQLQNTYGANLSGVLLNHVLQKEFIDVVILGIENVNQLRENIEKIENSTAVNMEIPYLEEEIVMPSLWPSKN